MVVDVVMVVMGPLRLGWREPFARALSRTLRTEILAGWSGCPLEWMDGFRTLGCISVHSPTQPNQGGAG